MENYRIEVIEKLRRHPKAGDAVHRTFELNPSAVKKRVQALIVKETFQASS